MKTNNARATLVSAGISRFTFYSRSQDKTNVTLVRSESPAAGTADMRGSAVLGCEDTLRTTGPATSGQQPPPPTHSEQTLRRSYLRQSLDQKNLLSIAILSIENEILNSRFKMILMSSVSIKAKRVQFQIVWYK